MARIAPPPAEAAGTTYTQSPGGPARRPLQFMVPPEIHRDFKVEAASRDIDMHALFLELWAGYLAGRK